MNPPAQTATHEHYWLQTSSNPAEDVYSCVTCASRYLGRSVVVVTPDGLSFYAKPPPPGYIVSSAIKHVDPLIISA